MDFAEVQEKIKNVFDSKSKFEQTLSTSFYF